MNDFLQPLLIRRLAREVSGRWPHSLGWALVVAGSPNSVVWVHVRPFLHVPDMPQGFSLQRQEFYGFQPCSDPRYVTLFVRQGAADFPPEVYELMGRAQEQSLPWLAIQVAPGAEAVTVFEQDGPPKQLPHEVPPLRVGALRIKVNCEEEVLIEESLPLELRVESDAPAAAVSLTLLDQSGFSKDSYHYVVRSGDGQPLGRGTLRLGANCRAGQPDELVFQHAGFEHEVSAEEWETPPRTEATPVFHNGPVNLHLLFDRTTLDVDAWPVAYEALDSVRPDDSDVAEAFVLEQAPGGDGGWNAGGWNIRLREALADALLSETHRLHDDVALHLWWFADIPRNGIAMNDSVPWVSEPCGRAGHFPLSLLKEQLSSPSFDYASGFDLFDAVDESLEQVGEFIAEQSQARRAQHAVLIVGDSPPPPATPAASDHLWKRLVSRPVRTNARCSLRFTSALEGLSRLRVPVGWLFIRTSRAPSASAGYGKKYMAQFQYFQTIREDVLAALRQFSSVVVEDCAGTEDLPRALGRLLGQMARTRPRIPGFHFTGAGPAGRPKP